MSADSNETGNGRVTLALVQRTAEENHETIKRIEDKLDRALEQLGRHDERIKNLSNRSNALDVLVIMVGAFVSALFGRQ